MREINAIINIKQKQVGTNITFEKQITVSKYLSSKRILKYIVKVLEIEKIAKAYEKSQ